MKQKRRKELREYERTDAEYLDAREIPASLVTELATDLNGAVLRAANGRPTQLYVIVPVDGTLRISFGAGADLEKPPDLDGFGYRSGCRRVAV